MIRRVSATEARIRFGELMRRAVEDKEAIVVEWGEALRGAGLRGGIQPAEAGTGCLRLGGVAGGNPPGKGPARRPAPAAPRGGHPGAEGGMW